MYSVITVRSSASWISKIASVIPFCLIWRGTRYYLAICSFSSIEYPDKSMTSILSRRAGWIDSRELAVAMNIILERSKGVARKWSVN